MLWVLLPGVMSMCDVARCCLYCHVFMSVITRFYMCCCQMLRMFLLDIICVVARSVVARCYICCCQVLCVLLPGVMTVLLPDVTYVFARFYMCCCQVLAAILHLGDVEVTVNTEDEDMCCIESDSAGVYCLSVTLEFTNNCPICVAA